MVMITAVTMVPTIAKAVSGSSGTPTHSDPTTPTTNWTTTATSGERQRGLTCSSGRGSSRIRPMANQVRVAALAEALALAMAELATARTPGPQPAPRAPRARASQGLLFPEVGNSANLSGPKATVAA